MLKIIGTDTIGYPEKRNFVGLPFKKYIFKRKQNLFKVPSYLYYKIFNRTSNYIINSFYDLDYHDIELFHFFNTLSYGKKPWVTTFETFLPRWNHSDSKTMRAGLRLISKDSCKKIIAISLCTKNIQKLITNDIAPEFNDVINEKLMVLHPSQECSKTKNFKKKFRSKIIFTIIGDQFFSKGGKEILIVFDSLLQQGYKNWHLNIISNLKTDGYVTFTSKSDVASAKRIIDKLSNHISHYSNIPNKNVLSILDNTNVGLLPSYAETYGYSVLELQSRGCPVITTDIRSMPEINNDRKGWMINVAKDSFQNAILDNEQQKNKFSKILKEKLEFIIRNILDNKYDLKAMGEICINDLADSVNNNTKILENLYDEISII